MSATPSTMLPLGTTLPAFALPDTVTGHTVDSKRFAGKRGALVMFICNHCPYVIHVRPKLLELANQAVEQGFAVVAINSNSVKTHPQDGPTHMKELATQEKWRFPFCFDDSQDVAKAFHAACTPDLFVFDQDLKLAYRGQLDDSRPNNGKPVTGADLSAALTAVREGKAPPSEQKASIGCNIKWHPDE